MKIATKYIIVGQSEVICGYNDFEKAKRHIRIIRKECPRHNLMSLYRLEFSE